MEELDEICNEDNFELYLSAMAEKTEYLTDMDWDEIFQQGFLRSLRGTEMILEMIQTKETSYLNN